MCSFPTKDQESKGPKTTSSIPKAKCQGIDAGNLSEVAGVGVWVQNTSSRGGGTNIMILYKTRACVSILSGIVLRETY